MSGSKVKNKDGKPELQIIISFCKPEIAQKIYKERWQIETAFRALKTSEFNLEDTHLKDIDRKNLKALCFGHNRFYLGLLSWYLLA